MDVRHVVMAHPMRAEWAHGLADTLRCPVVWDRGRGVWDTGRRALLSVAGENGWGVVVQDDTILTSGFALKVRTFLEDAPAGPVAFYAGSRARRHTRRLDVRRRGWYTAAGPTWGVAVATPADRIRGMVEWCDQLDIPNYDLRMRDYWQHLQVDCVYSVPCLADHRPVRENPSLADQARTADRRAAWFRP